MLAEIIRNCLTQFYRTLPTGVLGFASLKFGDCSIDYLLWSLKARLTYG